MSFAALWDSLLPVGRHAPTGGYRRYSWTEADAACRAWFTETAQERGLRASCDRAGNLWAWWDHPRSARGAIVTGSHLDSVPDGGAFDGPLGVVSAFAAIDLLMAGGFVPVRPIAVAAFCEEEGARFGLACLGTRLLTGAIEPEAARELRDGSGVSLANAMTAAGLDAGRIGSDPELLASISAFVELHVEQGWTASARQSGSGRVSGRTAAGDLISSAGPTTPARQGSLTGVIRCCLMRRQSSLPGRQRPGTARWPRSGRSPPSPAARSCPRSAPSMPSIDRNCSPGPAGR